MLDHNDKNQNKNIGVSEKNINYNKTFMSFLNDEENKDKKGFIITVIVIIAAVIIAVALFLVLDYFSDTSFKKTVKAIKNGDNDILKLEKQKFGNSIFNKRQNILILGVDSNGEGADPFDNTRSDTIIIASVNPKSHSVNFISIPRDSKVYIAHDNGIQKINSAHALGGVNLTKETIEETFGIKIHNYIVFNTEGVEKLVDALGGIPVYVEKNMKYHDYSGKLHVTLDKGVHVLNGKEAVGFLRYRKDALGDIGRTSRQQWFLRALAEKVKSPDSFAKIPAALKIAENYVKTDLSLYQMSQYAAFATSLDMSKTETATLPGAPNKRGYASYWILNPDQCREVINRLIYGKISDVDESRGLPSAGIMYTASKHSEAMDIKATLEEAGYIVNCTGRGILPHPQIIGHSPNVTGDFVNRLKRKIPEVADYQFVYDPVKMYCVQSDFTLIISGS